MFHLKLKNFEIEKFKIKIYLNYILKNTIEIHFFIKKLKYCVKYLKEPECCRNLLNIGRGTTPQIKKSSIKHVFYMVRREIGSFRKKYIRV